jgi:hypothetical protein
MLCQFGRRLREPAAAAKRISGMNKIFVALALLGACSPQGGSDEQTTGGEAAVSEAGGGAQKAQPGRIASLGGLYEGGAGKQKHQMCIVEGSGDSQRFGLVVWGSDLHSCAGSGTVTRAGDVLKLAMAGDSACTIEARISGKTVKLPQDVPAGCSYYCGAKAKLAGAELTQTGTAKSDAMKAKDLVGEPLCGSEGD